MNATQARLATIDELHNELEIEARRNGRREFALEVAKWATANRAHLPQRLIKELSDLIMKAGD